MTTRTTRLACARAALIVAALGCLSAFPNVVFAVRNEALAHRARSKDDLINELQTREAQLVVDQAMNAMERAKVAFDQTQRLFDDKIVTIDERDTARQAYEQTLLAYQRARIDLEKTRLGFLKDATFVTVVDAQKYRASDGQVMALIKLRNSSDINKARLALEGMDTIAEDQLADLLKIDNVVVSLRDQVVLICDPYQKVIPELRLGEEATLEFRLLKRDLDAVTIDLAFLDEHKEHTVFLKMDMGQDQVTIASSQYAQEGQLGTKIRYDLDLERLASTEQSFSMVVLNLPRALGFAFIDPESNARVTQVRFTEERSNQRLLLEIAIPERLDPGMIGGSIDFSVVITRPTELAAIGQVQQAHEGRSIPAETLATLPGTRLDLKLIPTGIGKLDLLIANLFMEVRRGHPADFRFSILNSGTLTLRNVTPKLNLPIDWEADLTPRTLPLLDPGEQTAISVHLRPPPNVAIGEYSLRLAAEGRSGIETIDAPERNFTLRLAAESNITGTVVLVALLVVLVLGIAIASIKISRR